MGNDLGLPSYMGRGIIVGQTTQGDAAAVYFVEGRSPPSRKRRLDIYDDERRVHVNVNSETSVEKMIEEGGNPDLLLYNAFKGGPDGLLVVSNGFQTDCNPMWDGKGREKENLKGSAPGGGIYHSIIEKGYNHGDVIRESLRECGSEVDPIKTARIAAVIHCQNPTECYVGIVARPRKTDSDYNILSFDDEDKVRVRPFPNLVLGEFAMLATYGVRRPPYHAAMPPSLEGFAYTRNVWLDGTSPEQLVDEVWDALPKELLVGVAAGMGDTSKGGGFCFAEKNMVE